MKKYLIFLSLLFIILMVSNLYSLVNIAVYSNANSDAWTHCWFGSGNGTKVNAKETFIPTSKENPHSVPDCLMIKSEHTVAGWGWFAAVIARVSWATFDITDYIEEGNLTFWVRGEKGGERFQVGLDDKSNPNEKRYKTKMVEITDYIKQITTEWQKASIPLKDFYAKEMNTQTILSVKINNSGIGESSENLNITLYLDDIIFESASQEKNAGPLIKHNYAGYRPHDEKIARASFIQGYDELDGKEFLIRDVKSGNTFFKGKIEKITDFDKASGDKVYALDFSALKVPGKYCIEIPSIKEKSEIFSIKDKVYNEVFQHALKMYYYQRCHAELTEEYAGKFTHKRCHEGPAVLLSDSSKQWKVSGGWHDAGDYGIYMPNMGITILQILQAYELYKDKMKDRIISIPENKPTSFFKRLFGIKGNGIPDILDEMRWGVLWVLSMQREDGGVYEVEHGTEWVAHDEKPPADPSYDKFQRYVDDSYYYYKDGKKVEIKDTPTTTSTALGCAIFANMSVHMKKYDKAFAEKCKKAALKAWDFLEKHPEEIPPQGGKSLVDSPYRDSPDSDERLFAAVMMLKLTGENKYNDYIKKNYLDNFRSHSGDFHPPFWGQYKNMALYEYYFLKEADKEIKSFIREKLKEYINRKLNEMNEDGYSCILRPDEYYWGSSAVLGNYGYDLIFAARIFKDEKEEVKKYRNGALNQLHYLLGCNPLGFSYVSKIGKRSVHHSFHLWFNNTESKDMPPGYVAGGPNSREGGVYSSYPAKCYRDIDTDYVTNEICLNWNASLVFLCAAFME